VSSPLSIFIWHHPADDDIAHRIKADILAQGYQVFMSGSELVEGGKLFDSVEWRLANLNFVVFIISEDSVSYPTLITNARSVLREKPVNLVLAAIDERGIGNLPILLKYIPFFNFHSDYYQALIDLSEHFDPHSGQNYPNTLYNDVISFGPIRWLIEHFRRYLLLPPLTFCWQITIENLIVSLSVTGLFLFFFQPEMRTNLDSLTAGRFLWLVIVFGPLIETIFLQMIPVFFGRIIGLKFIGLMVCSILPFATLHFTRSLGAGIGAGLIGGFYSAFTYVHWREKSLWTAFWTTTFSHCLFNLAIFAMIIGDY
jgi:hypothetical protein